jgi:hypothetical protein
VPLARTHIVIVSAKAASAKAASAKANEAISMAASPHVVRMVMTFLPAVIGKLLA